MIYAVKESKFGSIVDFQIDNLRKVNLILGDNTQVKYDFIKLLHLQGEPIGDNLCFDKLKPYDLFSRIEVFIIDRIEEGLDRKQQHEFLKIIFNVAKKLNTQFFITTHSMDIIYSFSEILSDPENTVTGKVIRIDENEGKANAVEFDAEELKVCIKNNIEIR